MSKGAVPSDLGLWPTAYVGTDGMSDKIGALWMSPMSFILDPHGAEVQNRRRIFDEPCVRTLPGYYPA